MARPPRIEFPGAFYHVMVRGNQRKDIFLDDQDKKAFLDRVLRYKKEQAFLLFGYALMPNHVHLLLETREIPLSKIMQGINLTYTQFFHKKYKTVGHVFQGRYKALLCDRDEYLLALVRYIHLNPVRAGLAKDPQEYRWSSHRDYLGGFREDVDTRIVLGLFSERISRARRQYREFVEEAVSKGKDESLYPAKNQQVLGDDRFLEVVDNRNKRIQKPLRKPSFQEIMKAVGEVTGISMDQMKSRGRSPEAMTARGVLAGAWKEFGRRLVDLQPWMGRDLSVLSRWARSSESADGRRKIELVLKRLHARLQA